MQLNSFNNISEISSIIKIDNYILELILPKCNLIFGKSFSSVYLQILLHLNNDKNSEIWKRKKCWISDYTIAKNVKCNIRTVQSIIKNMEDIGMVQRSYHGKLRLYSLQHLNITDFNEIDNINKTIENKLIEYCNLHNKERNDVKKFKQINIQYYQNANTNYQFKNINDLRRLIGEAESVQTGSTLLFIIFFAKELVNNSSKINISKFSENEIALKLGCSQSTINRYLKKLRNINFLNINNNVDAILNREMLIMEEKNKLENEKIICPICGKELVSEKKLNSHISRCKDEYHVMFKQMQTESGATTVEAIMDLYSENKEKFEEVKNQKENKKKELNSLAIKLVRYYYGLNNMRCPNWNLEMNLIKSHLKTEMTPDEIMEVMRFMAKRGDMNLRFFNNSINDTFVIKKCKEECKTEGTDSYFVRTYYMGMKQKLTDRLMLQGIKKINELKANGYDTNQIRMIVEYMVDKKCPNFNFIVSIANEALTKSKDKEKMTKIYSTDELINAVLNNVLDYGMIMLKDNEYEIAKKDVLFKLKDDICDGKVELTRINKTYSKYAIELAKEVCKRKIYNSKFTTQQWITNIQLDKITQM